MSRDDSHPSDDQVARLRGQIQHFIRGFGLLSAQRTPCGQPLATSYAHALMVLLADEEPAPSVSALGAALGLDKSNASRLTKRMQAAGHLKPSRCAIDNHTLRLRLTESGRALALRVEQSSLARFAQLLDAVPAEQRVPLLDALAALNRALMTLTQEAPCDDPDRR